MKRSRLKFALELGVQIVPERIAQEVDRKHGGENGQSGEEGHPP